MTINVTNHIDNASFETLIGTHNGVFHADEVLGTVILARALGEQLTVLRSSNNVDLSQCDVVYDIGGGEFDHHQRGGNGKRDNGVSYSSAGLLWKEYGKSIIESIDSVVDVGRVFEIVDRDLIQGIDAFDNGDSIGEAYLSLGDVIAYFNPNWDEDSELSNAKFVGAVLFASQAFDVMLKGIISKVKAEQTVSKSCEESEGAIKVLSGFMSLQKMSKLEKKILYVVSKSVNGSNIVQAVPLPNDRFNKRKLFPKDWAGRRGKEFVSITGIEDAEFCHPDRFICGAKTWEGALRLAQLAIEATE